MTAAAPDFAEINLVGRRRARSLSGARRRSRRVQGLKITLVAAMAALGLNSALQLLVSGGGGPDQPMTELSGGERIVNPRFSGRDNTGQPFLVTALTAARRGGGLGAIADLERPSLDYTLVNGGVGEASRVLAATGVFDETEQSLLLRDEVELRTRSGYAFETQSALIRLNDGVITGDESVYGEAPWGAVRAGRFEIYDETRRIVLEDGVRSRLYMEDRAEGAP